MKTRFITKPRLLGALLLFACIFTACVLEAPRHEPAARAVRGVMPGIMLSKMSG
jgi:hypothetical protein